MDSLPLLVSPSQLAERLDDPRLLLVDLSKPGIYRQAHLRGAVHVDYARLQKGSLPAAGLVPDAAALTTLFSDMGLSPDRHVVAYDDEGGGRAARLLWLLEIVGHRQASLLDGGIHAWLAEDLPTLAEPVAATPTHYVLPDELNPQPVATQAEVLASLGKENVVLWDARSPEEFDGSRQSAQRAGHIPGAVNYEWTRAMDMEHDLRLRDPETLRAELAALGIVSGKQIITYCQTHHRASFTWFVGKWLGFDIRGYAGAWAEWGNAVDTPVATGN